MLTLLCGPSSAGKSTFYRTGNLQRFLQLDAPPPIVFAHEFPARTDVPDGAVVHYNIMRPFHATHGADAVPSAAMNDGWSFESDPAWRTIRGLPGPKQALVLVASQSDLLARTSARTEIEPGLAADSGVYPSDFWHAIYQHADLSMIYAQFLEACRAQDIPVRFIAAKDDTFTETSESDLYRTIRSSAQRYSADQIRELISGPNFEYQMVRLPFGLATSGQDRGPTTDIVLPADLRGQSVLDVGSALGAVAFEAEKRGAARVVGLEPRNSRFDASIVLKEILGSSVELRRESLSDYWLSFWQGELPERFDHVLLLNVIHHVDDPVDILAKCASLTKGTLAVEFPTLADPIFAGVPPELAAQLNAYPLMGVSTRGADQRFVFTASALERILLDHRVFFKSVEFIPSPMPLRMIGLFRM